MNWQTICHKETLDWLLGEDNPSVRTFTLSYLLNRAKDDPDVEQSRKQIMEHGVVPKILARQNKGGYWEEPENFYVRTKYNGTVWQFIILAELGADGTDKRIQKTCDFILDYSQDRTSGGFSYRGTQQNGGQHSGVIPCLTGNMVWSLIRFGRLETPQVQKALQWITSFLRTDDGTTGAPQSWPYNKFEMCWSKHTCIPGIVKSLKALAEIPIEKRTPLIKETIERGAEFLLIHHLYKRSHNLARVAKPKWTKLSFPWMWDTDVLEMAGILSRLGYKDKRMQEGIDLILSKPDAAGRWLLEHTYKGRFKVSIEQLNKPSKWITFNALRVLKAYSA